MRRDRTSVLDQARLYWPKRSTIVEDEDAEDWTALQTCTCPTLVNTRNLLVCFDCGTVYGVAVFKSYRSGWSRMVWQVEFDPV
jgi:hypothetical protein